MSVSEPNIPPIPPENPPELQTFACDLCYKNKTKCNKKTPCEKCSRLNRTCTYKRFNDPNYIPIILSRTAKVKELKQQISVLQKRLADKDSLQVKTTSSSLPEINLDIENVNDDGNKNKQKQLILPANPAISTSATNSSLISPVYTDFTQTVPFSVASTISDEISAGQQRLFTNFFSNPSPNVIINNEGWILPMELIEDVLYSFFSACNYWPTNFLHEHTFMASWTQQPKELIYILCARGAEYNVKYSQTLQLTGRFPGEVFYLKAKKLLDVDEHSYNNLLAVIHLCSYSAKLGRFKSAWVYSSLLLTLCTINKLHIDPDELEVQLQHRWTILEKELRRRVWWCARFYMDVINVDVASNVKRPLSSRIFQSLPDNLYTLDGAFLPSPVAVSYRCDLDAQTQELLLFAAAVLSFHHKSNIERDRTKLLNESAQIYGRLKLWYSSIPNWLLTVTSPNAQIYPLEPSSALFWAANTAVLFYHSLVLTLFRFSLIDLCKEQKFSENGVGIVKYSATSIFRNTSASRRAIILFLSEILLKYDPTFKNVSFLIIAGIMAVGKYCSTLSRFGDTQELRELMLKDFMFVKSLCEKLALTKWKVCAGMLIDMQVIRTTTSQKECVVTLQRMINNVGSLSRFEVTDAIPTNNFPINSDSQIVSFPTHQTEITTIPFQLASDNLGQTQIPTLTALPLDVTVEPQLIDTSIVTDEFSNFTNQLY
ncbi:hypothetical protein HK098_006747 [Nowakowskiella sp. JEL0407]|nr:hypothetical protein HK098_006747 [Nowakowskiella sp. JEL0407]